MSSSPSQQGKLHRVSGRPNAENRATAQKDPALSESSRNGQRQHFLRLLRSPTLHLVVNQAGRGYMQNERLQLKECDSLAAGEFPQSRIHQLCGRDDSVLHK